MKKIFSLYLIMIIIGLMSVFAKENYKKKEILFIPWGTGNNNIGLTSYKVENSRTMQEEIMKGGPSKFEVDSKGNIYVDDTVKERIIKFDNAGKYVSEIKHTGEDFDIADGKIYLLDELFENYIVKATIIEEYNNANKLLRKWEIPVKDMNENSGKLIKVINNNIFLFNSGKQWQIGTITEKFKVPKLKKEEGKLGGDGKRYIIVSSFELKVIDENGKDVKKIKLNQSEDLSNFERIDNQGNIYFIIDTTYVIALPADRKTLEVHKYNNDGILLTVIKLTTEYYTEISPANKIIIDDKGNVYQMLPKEKGVFIIKYEKQDN